MRVVEQRILRRSRQVFRVAMACSTRARIFACTAGHPEEADLLEAVKWIGNDASHEDSLSVADVLDGVELLEHALRLLYDTRPVVLKERATRINKQRGTRPPAAI
ncbi:hypothetical protein GCM10018966_067650 [Streptomyces yanii]